MTQTKHTPEKLDTKWVEITDRLYLAYGSETGILFGIPADLRRSVEVIVKTVIEMCSPAPEITAERDRLREAHRAISSLHGNMSLDSIEKVGGINDGRDRAIKLRAAIEISRAALAEVERKE